MTHIEAVAEAIFNATERYFSDAISWEKLTAPEQNDFKVLAQAAIDALGLTEERRELLGEDWHRLVGRWEPTQGSQNA